MVIIRSMSVNNKIFHKLVEKINMNGFDISVINDKSILSLIVGESIKSCYVHPVRLEIIFKDLLIDHTTWTDELIYSCDPIDWTLLGEILKNFLKEITWDTIIFETTKLRCISNKTGVTDNSGAGCGHLGLDVKEFDYTIMNPLGITLKDLTEVIYRLKGSKFDYLYEFYQGIHYKISSDDSDMMEMEVYFGYGS